MKTVVKLSMLGALCGLGFYGGNLSGAESLLLQESFETDGSGSRYIVFGEGDDNQLNYFSRRQVYTAGTKAEGGTLDGQWMWAASAMNSAPGPRGNTFEGESLTARQGRLRFNGINITDMGNIRIQMAAATGDGQLEADNDLWIRVRFDGGEWIEVGGFKPASSNTRPIYYAGPRATVTKGNDPNLIFNFFTDWSWPVIGSGSVMDMDITMDSNHFQEEYYLDNVRVYGESGARYFDVSFQNEEMVEPASGSVANPITITLASPAPEGGVTFEVTGGREAMNSVDLGTDTFFISQGQTTLVLPSQVVQDGGYTGTETIDIFFSAAGYNTERARLIMENTTPMPGKLTIMEILNVVPGTQPDHLFGDANGDGYYHNTRDQAIEIVNFEDYAIDLSGWVVGEELGARHEFPEGTILHPNQAIVIFGGGIPRGAFGGAIVQVCSSGGNGLGFDIASGPDFAFVAAPFNGVIEVQDFDWMRVDMVARTGEGSIIPAENVAYGRSASIHRTHREMPAEEFMRTIHSLIPSANFSMFSLGTWPDGTPYFTPENEVTLTLSGDTISEAGGANAATGTITLASPAPAGGFVIRLETDGVMMHSNGTFSADEIDLDTLDILIAEGQTAATFRIGAHDDGVLDGDQVVSIYARGGSSPYVVPGLVNLTVTDVAVNDLDVVINEIMVDVVGTDRDFNLDGLKEDRVGDQFIEIVNNSSRPVNMSGWTLTWDAGGTYAVPIPSHVFPAGTWVPAGGAIVVFGNITAENAANPMFGGALVQGAREADGNRKFNGVDFIAGQNIYLKLANNYGYLMDEFNVPSSVVTLDQSVTLSPDITGEQALHFEASGFAFSVASPGIRIDGTPFSGSSTVLLTDIFNQAVTYTEDTWFDDPVFGLIAMIVPNGIDLPWVYAEEPGTFWFTYKVANGFWVYDMELAGWFWTSYSIYPWIWQPSSGSSGSWVSRFVE